MRIVVLDGYGVNPGDITWAPIEHLGDVSTCARCNTDPIPADFRDAEIVLIDQISFTADTIQLFPALQFLGLFATGYDQVDLDALRDAGVAVANVPEYSRASVAQLTFALILEVAHHVSAYDRLVHTGGWQQGTQFSYLPQPNFELAGKPIGILGLGAIGSEVARIATAFGMQVLGWDERRKPLPGVSIRWAPWERFLGESDIVTLHLPLNEKSAGIINEDALRLMKRGSVLINTARGGLISDVAVAGALKRGHLAGAGLDVLGPTEPPYGDNPLLSAPNCIITPHIGWATREARQRCIDEVARNIESFLNGGDRNRLV